MTQKPIGKPTQYIGKEVISHIAQFGIATWLKTRAVCKNPSRNCNPIADSAIANSPIAIRLNVLDGKCVEVSISFSVFVFYIVTEHDEYSFSHIRQQSGRIPIPFISAARRTFLSFCPRSFEGREFELFRRR